MTLSQYLHSDSNSSSDEMLMDVLQQISSLVDSNDDEQVDLFSNIHLDPNAQDAPLKMIKLLTLLIKSRMKIPQIISAESNITVNRLVSYLQNFVSFIQALANDSSLLNLFLVGENKTQTFSELQKTALLEQAARARSFLSSIDSEKIETCLTDYKKYTSSINNLPEKMKELKSIKKQIERADQIENLRSYSKTVVSILETALLFNDILIQNSNKDYNVSPKQQKSSTHQYKKVIKKLKNKIECLNDEFNEKNIHLTDLQNEINDLRKENEGLMTKVKKSSRNDEKVTIKFESLQAQRDQLADDLNSLKLKVQSDTSTAETMNKLKEKLKKVENENRKMRELLDEATLNQNQLNNQLNAESRDMKSELQSKQYENNLLKQQINQMMEQINNYQTNSDKKETKISNLIDKNQFLSAQVNDLSKTNSRLQARINDLENLYKDIKNQLENSENSKQDLSNQVNKLRKEIKTKTTENDELKSMLDRTTADAQKQMADNAILIKQLRRAGSEKQDSNKYNDVIQKLKEKLRSAYLFIKKLQNQISEYKSRMKKDNVHYNCDFVDFSSDDAIDDYDDVDFEQNRCFEKQKQKQKQRTYYCEVHETSPFNYNALDSKLKDLNATIHQLERTVHKSRAQTCLSSSSEQ